jgi:hypothetical protein
MRVNSSQPVQCTGTELKLDTPRVFSEPDHKFLQNKVMARLIVSTSSIISA